MDIEITESLHAVIDGKDWGHVADVIINNLATVDKDDPAASISYRVARAMVDAHKEQIAAMESRLNQLRRPQPHDPEAIEAAAIRRANEIKAARMIEERAQQLAAS